MENAYTILWTRDRCKALRKAGDEGKPLRVLFGGVHISAPPLKYAGVESGDVLYPVSVYKGTLYILAGVIIDRYVELAEYAVNQLGLERSKVVDRHDYEITELIEAQCGPLGHRSPYGCGTEVALAARSTPLRFDLAVAPEQLAAIRFCPRRGAPSGLRNIRDGKLASVTSLVGHVRRLCGPSAVLFANLVGLSETAVS